MHVQSGIGDTLYDKLKHATYPHSGERQEEHNGARSSIVRVNSDRTRDNCSGRPEPQFHRERPADWNHSVDRKIGPSSSVGFSIGISGRTTVVQSTALGCLRVIIANLVKTDLILIDIKRLWLSDFRFWPYLLCPIMTSSITKWWP